MRAECLLPAVQRAVASACRLVHNSQPFKPPTGGRPACHLACRRILTSTQVGQFKYTAEDSAPWQRMKVMLVGLVAPGLHAGLLCTAALRGPSAGRPLRGLQASSTCTRYACCWASPPWSHPDTCTQCTSPLVPAFHWSARCTFKPLIGMWGAACSDCANQPTPLPSGRTAPLVAPPAACIPTKRPLLSTLSCRPMLALTAGSSPSHQSTPSTRRL